MDLGCSISNIPGAAIFLNLFPLNVIERIRLIQSAICLRAEPSEAVIGVAGGYTIIDKLGNPLFQVVGVGAGVGLAVDDFHQIGHIVVVVVLPAALVAVTVRILPDDPGGPVGGVVVVPLGADQCTPGDGAVQFNIGAVSAGKRCGILLDPHQRAFAVVEVPQLRTGSATCGVSPQQRDFGFSAGGMLYSWDVIQLITPICQPWELSRLSVS